MSEGNRFFFERHEQGQGTRHAVNNILQKPMWCKKEFEDVAHQLGKVDGQNHKTAFGLGYYDVRVGAHALSYAKMEATEFDLTQPLPPDFLSAKNAVGVLIGVRHSSQNMTRSAFSFKGMKKMLGLETQHVFCLRRFDGEEGEIIVMHANGEDGRASLGPGEIVDMPGEGEPQAADVSGDFEGAENLMDFVDIVEPPRDVDEDEEGGKTGETRDGNIIVAGEVVEGEAGREGRGMGQEKAIDEMTEEEIEKCRTARLEEEIVVKSEEDGQGNVWFELDSKKGFAMNVGSSESALKYLARLRWQVGRTLTELKVFRVVRLDLDHIRKTVVGSVREAS
uniref:ubiquitinyl hydrolase 1 n=1 Tax=Chromera velia CCMP2878 TaxID=1169474 RepID=A0A0G4IEL1_9ALVE|eukprot:Cvel_2406.t1-p1 / transcript=Cvel_2406.t1 / gene=Cvel_2406 / organism=Chromera_velia_CCMP2878 / gene_product=hypothetical protein / transcript_product=hypothetical protein / location=Cvel_scaffold94:12950-16406(-) / protein_length=335 / sequence_SO=supercontig / SO=protein_coding / is_pseudo=false